MQVFTITQEAKQGLLSEFRLRQMQKQGRLPGFYSGTRYYVNHDMLVEQIEAECRKNMGEAISR